MYEYSAKIDQYFYFLFVQMLTRKYYNVLQTLPFYILPVILFAYIKGFFEAFYNF